MNNDTENNRQVVERKSTWVRMLYMLLFVITYGVAEFALAVAVVIQVLIKLITGSLNERLKIFGKQVTLYIYDVLQFLTFNSEEKPFPFADWPSQD